MTNETRHNIFIRIRSLSATTNDFQAAKADEYRITLLLLKRVYDETPAVHIFRKKRVTASNSSCYLGASAIVILRFTPAVNPMGYPGWFSSKILSIPGESFRVVFGKVPTVYVML